jgi:hypothetical protein
VVWVVPERRLLYPPYGYLWLYPPHDVAIAHASPRLCAGKFRLCQCYQRLDCRCRYSFARAWQVGRRWEGGIVNAPMNRQFSVTEKAKEAFDKAGFSTKASIKDNLRVADALTGTALKGAKNLLDTKKESWKAKSRGSDMALPSSETFQTRKYLNDLLEPNSKSSNAMGLSHLCHKTKDPPHRDFILDKILGKMHVTNAATERDIGVAEKVRFIISPWHRSLQNFTG